MEKNMDLICVEQGELKLTEETVQRIVTLEKEQKRIKAEYDAMVAAGESERTVEVPLTVVYTPHFNQAHFPDAEFDRTFTITINLG